MTATLEAVPAISDELARRDATEPIRIVYVAGYGRSGSTLLERVIGAHPEVAALGEIAYLTDDRQAAYFWSCVGDSPLWSEVRARLNLPDEALPAVHAEKLRHESLRRGWLRWLLGPSRTYLETERRILEAIAASVPGGTRILIDSSKTARERFFRPFQLARIPGVDVRVIQMVRDGRGCLFSVLKGSNQKMEQSAEDASLRFAGLRACLGWTLANLAGALWRLTKGRSRHLLVRYEDFVDDPQQVLSRVEEFLDVDLAEQKQSLRDGRPIPVSDQFAGNRMRHATNIVLKRDDAWKQQLPFRYRALFWLICWPVQVARLVMR